MRIRLSWAAVLAAVASLAVGIGGAAGGEFPPLPRAGYEVLESWSYPTSAAAAAAWQPMEGSAKPGSVRLGGRNVLRLPCNLAGTKIDRAGWNLSFKADLSLCRGVQFRVYCPDTKPVGRFSFYFRSEGGWYASSFVPDEGKWTTVRIAKSSTKIEGSPAGWGRITGLRVSAWRGLDRDAVMYLADLGAIGGAAPVAVVRADSTAAREAKAVATRAGIIAGHLDEAGVDWMSLSDLDITPERLEKVKLIILPHNSDMPAAAARAVGEWAASGGRMLAFHYLPRNLREAAALNPGPYIHRPGYYTSIRFAPGALAGAPGVVNQRSWGSHSPPVGGGVRALARWHDPDGAETPHAAVVASATCIYMSHVVLEDDADNQRRMLLAMVGHFVPEAWKTAAEAAIARIGRFGPYGTTNEADSGIRREAGIPPTADWGLGGHVKVRTALALAWREGRLARRHSAGGKYAEAIGAATRARRALLEAYCLAQKPLADEFRGIWCHSAYGVSGMTWDEAAKALAGNGFTDLFPNMCWGGAAYYPSELLPVAAEVARRGDAVRECLAACRKYGLRCHVWKVNWNLGGRRAPKEFVEKLRKAGRLQADSGGKGIDWLCPSHPENRKLEIESMLEVARKYDVDGLHFDYIRYPGPHACFCPGCRRRFEEHIGGKVGGWPGEVRRGGRLEAKWLDWRRRQITAVVKAVAERAEGIRPGVRISAAVFGNWPADRDKIGQDWKLWCERGWLDLVCPMDYTSSASRLRTLAGQQAGWAGRVPCYPGIGLSCARPTMRLDGLIEQIKVTRELGTQGFMIFQLDSRSTKLIRMLGLGLTRPARRP